METQAKHGLERDKIDGAYLSPNSYAINKSAACLWGKVGRGERKIELTCRIAPEG